MEALEWLGIPPDETIGKNEKFGPYRQSERKPLYKDYADQLINTGWAYYAFDSAEALDAARKEQEEKENLYLQSHQQRNIRYLVISTEETAKRIANGDAYVIRFKTQLVKPCICKISSVVT
jgi:glutamyl-tRNA synthetase